jgi:hypothetical protein
MSITTGTFPGVRIVDMPDLGALNDTSSVVGERAGSGRFSALAFRNYVGYPPTSVKQFGAVGDGVADDTFAIQAAIDSLSAYGGGVALPPGRYRITAPIKMRPNIVLQGNGGATIIQGNAANLTTLIDYDTYAAASGTLVGIAFDGNRANNTNSNLTYIVASSQPNTHVINCVFNNVPGVGLLLQGANPIVQDNLFVSVYAIAIMLWGLVPTTSMAARVSGNRMLQVGYFGISAIWSDYNVITGNTILSVSLTHHVSTVGTAVTLVSGADFSALRAGMFMRLNAGAEFQIVSIQSPSALTLNASAGTLTNVAANSGQADMINIDCCAYNTVTENTLQGGMSGGVVVHNSKGSTNCIATIVAHNSITGMGNMGVMLISNTGSATTIDSTLIAANTIINCGVGFAAAQANTSNGITIVGNLCNNTMISGNLCNGFAGGTQQYGIYVDAGVVPGMTAITGNVSIGNAVGDVFGGGWRVYTPGVVAVTGAFTSATATGRYRQMDKTIQFQVSVTITTNGTAAGGVTVGLPRLSSSVVGNWFSVGGRGGIVSGKALAGSIQPSSNTVTMFNYDSSYPGANGELLVISGTYEAA